MRGFRDVFWIDFMDTAAGEAYSGDEEHQAVMTGIMAGLDGEREGIFVCDISL